MTKLSVNLNKVATLRNTRDNGIPSVVRCAEICIAAGAHGITVHPRPDERHIRAGDVSDLAALLREHPRVELNVEGNPFEGLLEHVERARPTQATLVPDAAGQKTSDHGWNLARDGRRLAPVIARLRALGCRVSLFVDADLDAVARAHALGVDRVELYTEPYARGRSVTPFVRAAREAARLGVGVNAGHDLSLANVGPFLARVPNVLEVSIGHALVADALELGLARTVKLYLTALGQSSTSAPKRPRPPAIAMKSKTPNKRK